MKTPAVAATALGLSRNEASRRFPHAEDPAVLEDLRTQVADLLQADEWNGGWQIHDLDRLSMVEVEHLVERGLMTPGFAEGVGEGRGFAVYGEGQASLEINGVDHLRVLGFRPGEQLDSLWDLLNLLDDRLETVFAYAFDPRWGYLSSRPRQSGSGMRVYATMILPGLMISDRLAGLAVELANEGLGVSPLWGGAGGVVQVSNVVPQGKPEVETIEWVGRTCSDIMDRERSVRKMLFRENPVQARDQIGRALGAAQQSWSMSFLEAVNTISALEAGRGIGLVEAQCLARESAFSMMTRLQPAHIMVEYMEGRTGCLESPEIDEQRARLMREIFADSRVRP